MSGQGCNKTEQKNKNLFKIGKLQKYIFIYLFTSINNNIPQ